MAEDIDPEIGAEVNNFSDTEADHGELDDRHWLMVSMIGENYYIQVHKSNERSHCHCLNYMEGFFFMYMY